MDVTLTLGASVSGSVSDANGLPIEGVRLTAFGSDGDSGWAQGMSDEFGQYEISGLARGAYTIRVERAGFAVALYETPELDSQESWPMDVQLSPGKILTGLVASEDSHLPISGAVVALHANAGWSLTFETNEEGQFTSDMLEPGSYYLQASSEGFCTSQQMFEVVATSDPEPLSVVLIPGVAVQGAVTQSDQMTPLAGAIVELRKTSTELTMVAETDEIGAYRFDHVPPGQYIATVRHADHSFVDQTVNVEDAQIGNLDFFAATGHIHGEVSSASDGSAVVGLDVIAILKGDQDLRVSAVTDADGSYSLPSLPAGDYLLVASGDAYERMLQHVTLPEAATVDADFSLAVGAELSGTITDAQTGEPLSDVLVQIWNPQGGEWLPRQVLSD